MLFTIAYHPVVILLWFPVIFWQPFIITLITVDRYAAGPGFDMALVWCAQRRVFVDTQWVTLQFPFKLHTLGPSIGMLLG